MKRIALALTLVTALIFSAIVTTQVVSITEANPIGMFPTEPEPLVVTILSPKNGSRCFQERMSVAFALQNPTLGGANSLTYTIDGQVKGDIDVVVTAKEGERFIGFFDIVKYSAIVDLSGLSDGWHTLTIDAAGASPYNPSGGMGSIDADVYGSASIQFLFDTVPPSVSILLPQNKTYTTTDVPLNFTLSEKADWAGYSIDEQTRMTITGNTTLVGLFEGLHSLTVYANDTVGRFGTSETVYFTIAKETEHTPTAQTEPEPFSTPLVAAASAVAVAVVSGGGFLLYYIKFRKKEAG
jgi:hypothetical protein